MNPLTSVTIIIPTLNEEKNIGMLLSLVTTQYPGIKIIVADDGSKDQTKVIVDKFKNILFIDRKNEKIKGLTASIIDGIFHTKTKFFIVMDGDLQHPPEKLKEFVVALNKGVNIVVGVRRKVLVFWPWYRRLMSHSATLAGMIRLAIYGVHCKDILSGFFAMKTKDAVRILTKKQRAFQPKGYKILFDFLKNMRCIDVVSVYYDFGLRDGGKSKMGLKVVYYYFRSLFS